MHVKNGGGFHDTICAITRIGSAAAVFIGAVWALVEVIVILIKGV